MSDEARFTGTARGCCSVTISAAVSLLVLGAPNAGKSTLINALVGAKISIVSPKVQTTRTRIRGIVMAGATQLVFIDTPGIFAPKRRLDRAMVKAAWTGAEDADIIAVMVDAQKGVTGEVQAILEAMAAFNHRGILILNKVDQLKDKSALLRPIRTGCLKAVCLTRCSCCLRRPGKGRRSC